MNLILMLRKALGTGRRCGKKEGGLYFRIAWLTVGTESRSRMSISIRMVHGHGGGIGNG